VRHHSSRSGATAAATLADRGGRQRRPVPTLRPLALPLLRGIGQHVDRSSREPSHAVLPGKWDVPLPKAIPTIAWRVGLDLNPLDARQPAARRWLQCLVWPEHHDRARTLQAALDLAADIAPRIEKGNLVSDLPALIEQAPRNATLVVVHSATLFYLDHPDREVFTAMLSRHGGHRIGCEGPDILPQLTQQLPSNIEVGGLFLLSLDDRVLGLAHPHGRTLSWL
jgi:hypothetical protein